MADRPAGTYNLAGDGTVCWSEMAALLGRRLLTMPAPVLYPLAALGWHLRLQSESPARGIDFIRYRWTADTQKAKRELGVKFRYTSRQALEAFARGTKTAVSSERR
jgi:UDP-glucose 4-epimerase